MAFRLQRETREVDAVGNDPDFATRQEDSFDVPFCDVLGDAHDGIELPSDARRLKTLEDENTRLKKLLAEAMLDNAILKDVAAKKW